jgi:hypothetical protein
MMHKGGTPSSLSAMDSSRRVAAPLDRDVDDLFALEGEQVCPHLPCRAQRSFHCISACLCQPAVIALDVRTSPCILSTYQSM